MPINYIIHANVIDILSDVPRLDDVFFVDTNIWYWMTYTRASQSNRPPWPYQTDRYPNYVNDALSVGARLCQSGLNLAELAHSIERTEREIHEKSRKTLIKAKEYRHNFPNERRAVVSQIQAAWGQVSTLAESLHTTIERQAATQALDTLNEHCLDGYDVYILQSMRQHGIVQIITDDGDFATIPGVQVFTANRRVVEAATAQSRLTVR